MYRGILLPETFYGRRAKISQYADDKAVYLHSPADYTAFNDILDLYARASGARVNEAKSKMLLLGSAADNPAPWSTIPIPRMQPGETTKYLGFLVGPDVVDSTLWQQVVDKTIRTLALWSRRSLSLSGRTTVIRTLATSKLWYVASIVAVDADSVKTLERALFKFLWNGKPAGLVNRAVCYAPITTGGLNVPSVDAMLQALHVSWLKRLLDNTDSYWKDLAYDELRHSPVSLQRQLDLRVIMATLTNHQRRQLSASTPFWSSRPTLSIFTSSHPRQSATCCARRSFGPPAQWISPRSLLSAT